MGGGIPGNGLCRLAGREFLDGHGAGVNQHRGVGLEPLVIVATGQIVGGIDALSDMAEQVDTERRRPSVGADDTEEARLPS